MNEKQPTYRIEIKNSGQPPNENFGWKIYRNLDVLPILHSQQFFVSRMAGLADANRSRRQLVDTDMQSQTTKELIHITHRTRFEQTYEVAGRKR